MDNKQIFPIVNGRSISNKFYAIPFGFDTPTQNLPPSVSWNILK